MDLSVIIVCYKGYDKLRRCLQSLDAFSPKDYSMEVIVVNNNPGDARITEFEKSFPGFRFIHNNVNGGYANGCNLGCSAAGGDYYLILNPDTTATEDVVIKLLQAAISNPGYFVISCRQARGDGKESKAWGSFPWNNKKVTGPVKREDITFPDWVSGSVMLISKVVFRKLGGFDEDFWMYYEDVDLCRRARDNGGEIAFYNKLIIQHDHGASSRAGLRTTATAKCEVQISRHLYNHKHQERIRRTAIHTLVAADNLVTGLISGLAGLIFFFIPVLFVRFLLFLKLLGFYSGALLRGSWISPRSVNASRQKRRNI